MPDSPLTDFSVLISGLDIFDGVDILLASEVIFVLFEKAGHG